MNMTHTVYVKLDEITELTHKDILLRMLPRSTAGIRIYRINAAYAGS